MKIDMDKMTDMGFIADVLNVMATLFVVAVGFVVAVIFVMFIIDISQTKNAVRKNYPVIGRFRDVFITLGAFFRQYFFAMDREEMPFNRAERQWVYLSSKDKGKTVAFGSTKNISEAGTAIFVNCPFPTLSEDAIETQPLIIGPHSKHPYLAPSIFNISGMSYGALSGVAVSALSRGAKMANCWMNTGEGGLAPYHLDGGCDIVFQIGTAKYGVRDKEGNLSDQKLREIAAIDQVKMFEIKISQGAKPGKGGILPAVKVTEEIAEIRGIEAWQDSISPNGHPEIRNPKDLLDFIAHIREVTGKPVGYKTVIGSHKWIEQVCKEIQKCGPECAPDFITIDSSDGGTGAAPMALIDNVGLPLRESLPIVTGLLKKYGLKERIRVIVSGKLITPSSTAWAICAGADFITSARGFMFSLGCIQALKCNKNTCPTGITTHNTRLQKGLNPTDKAVRVANYCKNMVHEVEMIAHSVGVKEPREMKREHVRIVQANGHSVPLDELYPDS